MLSTDHILSLSPTEKDLSCKLTNFMDTAKNSWAEEVTASIRSMFTSNPQLDLTWVTFPSTLLL